MVVQTSSAMAENNEDYLDALNDFHRKQSKEIPEELEQLLCRIAQTGEPLFPWNKLKPLVVTKLENVIQDYVESNPNEPVEVLPNVENIEFKDMRDRLLQSINAFTNAPFTIQRLCELLTEPRRYYQRSDKFMRGFEKNIQVVSTVTSGGKRITSSASYMQSSTTCSMLNGVMSDSNGNGPHDEKFDSLTTGKDEHHHATPAQSTVPTDTVAMDTESTEENLTSLEQTEEKDVKGTSQETLVKTDSELTEKCKTESSPESKKRTENVDPSSEGQSLDLSSSQDKVDIVPEGMDSERTNKAGEESSSSSTNTGEGTVSVHKEDRQEEQKTDGEVAEQAEDLSAQDMTRTEGNGQPEQKSSSESDPDVPLSDTSTVKNGHSGEDTPPLKRKRETSPSPDTSNKTLPDTETTNTSADKLHEVLQSQKTPDEDHKEGAQQETQRLEGVSSEAAPSEAEEGLTQPSGESEPSEAEEGSGESDSQLETAQPKSETQTAAPQQQTISQTDRLLGQKESTEQTQGETTEMQENSPSIGEGDAHPQQTNEKSAEEISPPQKDAAKESDSSEDPKETNDKCKEGDMEVEKTLSSEQAKGDHADGKEETSEKAVPLVDEGNTEKQTESTCSTEEPMDQN